MMLQVSELLAAVLPVLLPWIVVLMAYVSLRRHAMRREIFTLILRAAVRLRLPLSVTLQHTAGTPHEVARLMRKTARRLQLGHTLGKALNGASASIPLWYARMVETGERHGKLAAVLDRVLETDSRDEQMRIDIFVRLLYPFWVLSILFFILGGVVRWIIPSFTYMSAELGLSSSLPTRALGILYSFGHGIGALIMFCMACLLILVVPFVWGPSWERLFWPWFWLMRAVRRFLPFFGRRYVRAACGRWAALVSTLLEAGATLPDAVSEAARTESDRRFRKAAERWAERVRGGERLGEALAGTRFVPRALIWQVNSEEGKESFPRALRAAGEREIMLVHRDYSNVIRVATPFLVLLLGAIVGLCAWALFGALTEVLYALLQ